MEVDFDGVSSIVILAGYKGEFRWFEYMRETKTQAAPVKLFQRVSASKMSTVKPLI